MEEFINRSGLFTSDRDKWKKEVNWKVKEIKKEIMLLEEGMHDLADSQANNYVGSIKSFKKKLEKLNSDIDKRERGDSFLGVQKSPIIQTREEKR